MPSADVVVVGAGLAGMTAALSLAERGARVTVLARGHAASHWVGGPIDVAAPPGATTASAGLVRLSGDERHPYAFLAGDVSGAVDWFLRAAASAGLPHAGSIDAPFAALPTGLGATRPVSIVPAGQAAALPAWAAGERLVIVGPAGFKDLWPHAVAASLGRPGVWQGRSRPESVSGLTVELPGIAGHRNLTALVLARLFDDSAWRSLAFDAIGSAIGRGAPDATRVALPAVLGVADHAAVLEEAQRRLGRPIMELPLVPPSVPGLRLYEALRAAIRSRDGRVQLGEAVSRVDRAGRRVTAIATAAAVRDHVVRTGGVVLATGGVTGGGIVGGADGRLHEVVLDLPVEGPPIEDWLAGNALDPSTHPIIEAGLRTDPNLRPIDPRRPAAGPIFDNVFVAGGLLAGQNHLRDRCGDGVALASGQLAAAHASGGVASGVAELERAVAR